MAGDFVPRKDEVFQAWAQNFDDYATAHLGALGLVPSDVLAVSDARDDFDAKMTAHVAAKQAAKAARQAKDSSRKVYEAAIRTLVRKLQILPAVSDAEREAMGITVRDTTPTQARGSIDTRPVAIVDTSQRLRHEISFSDETTPTRRAKPDGVMGCEIWVKIAAHDEPPSGPRDLTFVSLDTASPHTVEFSGDDGGKTAHYMLRWVRRSGVKGPWSETVSATIPA